ncbi:MAG: gamma-glutamyltransferase family protein, partial [Rhodospirillales bacterium]|nr:gamma-glutamyltransferase family protein [Rhodospirillales bacterium]
GNAFDAAVAMGFVMQIAEPHLCGPAGEVPLIVHDAEHNETKVICGQGVAPATATPDAYRDIGIDVIPGSGLTAAVVPGAFDAWMLLLKNYGTMTLRDVMGPAISYARNGCPLVPKVCATLELVRSLFQDEWTTSGDLWFPGGNIPKPNSLYKNPVLADTYSRIVKESESAGGDRDNQIEAARKIWSEGFIAETIDKFCRVTEALDVTGNRNSAFLRGSDMAEWEATVEDPLSYDYHNYTVYKTGPWGQGPVMLQQLALLQGFDLSGMSATDPDFVHLVQECAKLAYADRESFYGDPNFSEIPMDTLLSDDYNAARRKLVGDTASMEQRPGNIPGFGGPIFEREKSDDLAFAAAFGIGEPTVAKIDSETIARSDGVMQGDTVHFDIIDRHGNMVSGTPSGGWLQSSPAIPGLGFCLTIRAQMYWVDERSPSCIGPKRRPRTTLTPSMAFRDGKPYMAWGTPGGDQQDQWATHMLLRHMHFGMNLQEAIEAPGFNSSHWTGSFYPREVDPGNLTMEGRFPTATIEELRRRGHNVVVEDDWSLGRTTAAAKDGDMLKAAANPRMMQGYAVGR